MNGGQQVAEVLRRQGVEFVFTLCGGHISPILVGAKELGLRVVDVRHEATTVFAADAVARLTGVPGVAAVTAGPGVTNTITAVKNAQMAQSPVVLLGGATATVLEGRGSLQDIDQLALVRPHVKWARAVKRVRDLAPAVEEAFEAARSGVPGPVFVECPVDLLYPEALVRSWYAKKTAAGGSLSQRAIAFYLNRHLDRLFAGADDTVFHDPPVIPAPEPSEKSLAKAADFIAGSERPVLVIGSQAMADAPRADDLAAAVETLGMPVYLGGMARGLLGRGHPLQRRQQRRKALKEADLVLLAGFPADFRMDYGDQVRRSTPVIAVNRSRKDLFLNRRPTLPILADAGAFLRRLAERAPGDGRWAPWLETLAGRDEERMGQIAATAAEATEHLNPVALCQEVETVLPESSVLVADGGDFVATASYIVSPRGPLSWLDPGVFGTLGVGAGFALGAKLVRPESEVWLIYGDGSCGYSLAEFDTFHRHGLPVIALVGNDASWAQIAREQVEVLGDDVGTVLAHTAYHRAAEGFGGAGLELCDPAATASTLQRAQELASGGSPVLINAWIGKTDFRKGSISI